MLIFCNNFFSFREIKFFINLRTDECIILIQKNGTQSLIDLAAAKPDLYKIVSVQHLKTHNIKKVTVFIREPLSRAMSGLYTQMELYGITPKAIDTMMNQDEMFYVFDGHTAPQFWFLLRLATVLDVEFQIKPLSDLNLVDTDIQTLNVSRAIVEITNPTIRDRLIHFYTEDIVLYNQFLNTVCSVDQIIEKIKLEKDFVEDVQQYRQVLTYLL